MVSTYAVAAQNTCMQ